MISINISVIKTIYIYTILTDKIKHFFKEKLYNEIKKYIGQDLVIFILECKREYFTQ